MPGVGLSASLYMGSRSLATQRQALEVLGHNLANVNTPGAARQRVAIQTDITFESPDMVQGLGAKVTNIESLRNQLLDAQVVREESLSGLHSQRLSLLSLAEQSLGENFASSQVQANPGVTSVTGLQNSLNTFFDSWQALADDPTSNIARNEVLARSNGLAADLRTTYDRLVDVRGGLFPEAGSLTDRINTLSQQIGQLNEEISRVEVATQAQANDLRDRRQALIEDLAKEVNITVTSHAGNERMLDISLADRPALRLVSGVYGGGRGDGTDITHALSVDSVWNKSSNPELLIRATPSTGPVVVLGAGEPSQGQLGAVISVANGTLGTGTGADDQTLIGRLNQLALQLRDLTNSVHAGGTAWDLSGNPGGAFFTATGARDISVAITDPARLAAAGGTAFLGRLDGSSARDIGRLRTDPALGAYHRQTVANTGILVQQAQRAERAQELVGQQINREREAVSGISVDEEMANMIQYQRAFEASAKFITMIDEMMRTVSGLLR